MVESREVARSIWYGREHASQHKAYFPIVVQQRKSSETGAKFITKIRTSREIPQAEKLPNLSFRYQ